MSRDTLAPNIYRSPLTMGSSMQDIFEVKLTFEMLTVRGQQHSFLTHKRVFLWKCQYFWDRKCLDLRGTRTPNLRIHAECFNLLSYQGQTFAVPCFEHWLWWHRHFWSKVNIWNVNCAQATAFIFDTWTGVLVKVSKFLRQKMSRPQRDSIPQPLDSCQMLYPIELSGLDICCPMFSMNMSFFSLNKGFKYLLYLSFEKWYKMYCHISTNGPSKGHHFKHQSHIYRTLISSSLCLQMS